jgi:hypothetical protein
MIVGVGESTVRKILDCGGKAQRRHRFLHDKRLPKAAWRFASCCNPKQSSSRPGSRRIFEDENENEDDLLMAQNTLPSRRAGPMLTQTRDYERSPHKPSGLGIQPD